MSRAGPGHRQTTPNSTAGPVGQRLSLKAKGYQDPHRLKLLHAILKGK